MALKRKRLSDLNEEMKENKRSRFTDDIITITNSSNKIIYSEIESLEDIDCFDYASQMESSCLLPFSIEQMKKNIEEEGQKPVHKAIVPRSPKKTQSFQLWVDKYGPQKFRDLLSNEKTNRNVLKWIKQWDKVVFSQGTTKEGKDSRPDKKILLLAGAPGIGKTTLAHVLAKHSGYNPMEINASDDRTKSKFKPKIEAAIEMRSVFGDCKPNLLIIDEIDGIASSEGSGVAQVLINIANNKQKPLRRPIICICNDPYAPALRELRKHVMIFKLEKPKTSVLCCRLLEICKLEGIKTDAHTLSTLCSLADNDIRSCLNTLQFIRRKSSKVTTDMVKSSTVGQKDISKSVFNVWDQIFHPQHKKKAFQERLARSFGNATKNEPTKVSSTDYLNDLIVSHGNIEKIIEGCHSHFLSMKYLDTAMTKTVAICDSIAWASETATRLPKYSPFGVMKITLTIPQDIDPTLHFPVAMNKMKQRQNEFKNIFMSFLMSLKATTLQTIPLNDLTVEYFSHLVKILTPDVRVANETLLKDSEKLDNHHVAQLMSTYGLGYAQEMELDPITHCRSLVYKLDPPIDKLCSFDVVNNEKKKLTNVQKHMLFLALEKEKYKSSYRQQKAAERAKEIADKRRETEELAVQAQKKNSLIARTEVKNAAKAKTDFFGRVVGSTPTGKGSNKPFSGSPKYSKYSKHSVFFKFQEGYSNAVRRTVYVKDFL